MKTKIITDERVKTVSTLQSHLLFELMDGRLLAIPLIWYPRLHAATSEQLSRWEISGAGFVVRWPELNEDLEISGLLAGNPAPELRTSDEISGLGIREFRESSGISQDELAEQLGVRQATISDWEKEKISPSPLAATRLRELIRKYELTKRPKVPLSMQISWQSSDPRRCYNWWSFGSAISQHWDMSIDLTPDSTTVRKEYRFTETGLVLPAPEPRTQLSCALFNPSRQFLHSCSYQNTK